MGKLLAALLKNNNGAWLSQVLTGAGLGLASFAALNGFIDYYQAKLLTSMSGMGQVTGLLGIAGVDDAISMIIGAHLASAYIATFAAGVKVVKK